MQKKRAKKRTFNFKGLYACRSGARLDLASNSSTGRSALIEEKESGLIGLYQRHLSKGSVLKSALTLKTPEIGPLSRKIRGALNNTGN